MHTWGLYLVFSGHGTGSKDSCVALWLVSEMLYNVTEVVEKGVWPERKQRCVRPVTEFGTRYPGLPFLVGGGRRQRGGLLGSGRCLSTESCIERTPRSHHIGLDLDLLSLAARQSRRTGALTEALQRRTRQVDWRFEWNVICITSCVAEMPKNAVSMPIPCLYHAPPAEGGSSNTRRGESATKAFVPFPPERQNTICCFCFPHESTTPAAPSTRP